MLPSKQNLQKTLPLLLVEIVSPQLVCHGHNLVLLLIHGQGEKDSQSWYQAEMLYHSLPFEKSDNHLQALPFVSRKNVWLRLVISIYSLLPSLTHLHTHVLQNKQQKKIKMTSGIGDRPQLAQHLNRSETVAACQIPGIVLFAQRVLEARSAILYSSTILKFAAI